MKLSPQRHVRHTAGAALIVAIALFAGCKQEGGDKPADDKAAAKAAKVATTVAKPDSDKAAGDKVVNLYSHRHYESDKEIYAAFKEKTGIEVKVVKANADELIQRLKTEGQRSPADLFFAADVGRLSRAQMAGVLQPLDNAELKKRVPEHLRAPDGSWFGVSKRARVIVYDKTRTKPDALSTYEALAEPAMKGKILVRSGTNIYNQSLLASIAAHAGADKAEAWAKAVVGNMARTPKGSDRDQMKALAAGQGEYAIVNTYYVGLLVNSEVPEEQEVGKKMAVFFPNQSDRGTHVNVSGAGITKYAPHKENAEKLLEFLVSDEAQKIFVEQNSEFPVVAGLETSELIKSWGDFKEDTLSLVKVGELNNDAVKMFDRAGWR